MFYVFLAVLALVCGLGVIASLTTSLFNPRLRTTEMFIGTALMAFVAISAKLQMMQLCIN